jgi:hypothetical protein
VIYGEAVAHEAELLLSHSLSAREADAIALTPPWPLEGLRRGDGPLL